VDGEGGTRRGFSKKILRRTNIYRIKFWLREIVRLFVRNFDNNSSAVDESGLMKMSETSSPFLPSPPFLLPSLSSVYKLPSPIYLLPPHIPANKLFGPKAGFRRQVALEYRNCKL
jgi:hypothetical protein